MKIEKAIIIKGFSLIVFYILRKCWQYTIVSEKVNYECRGIFYSSEAAEMAGRSQVQMLLE